MMRGNSRLVGGCCPGHEDKHKLASGKDVLVRDDVMRVPPHLRKKLTARSAAKALGMRREHHD